MITTVGPANPFNPYVHWGATASRTEAQLGSWRSWSSDDIARALQVVEFVVAGKRHLGRTTTPPLICCSHLIVWRFELDDRHCDAWPVEDIVDAQLRPVELHA